MNQTLVKNIIYTNENILNYLIQKRISAPNVNFWLRRRNTNE